MQIDDNLSCAINSKVGREFELPFKSSRSKKVLVIGSGAAGLEAARLAASAGHTVSLFESQHRLGGSLVLASTLHADNEPYLKWLLAQIKRLPIEVHTGTDVNVDMVVAYNPDAVILAIGAKLITPDIPGVEQPHVLTGKLLRQMAAGSVDEDQGWRISGIQRALINRWGPHLQSLLSINFVRKLTRFWMPVGAKVIIIGADLVGVQMAEFLAERGRKVHLLDTKSKIAPEVGKKRRSEHMDRLDKLHVTVNTSICVERIEKQSVVISAAGKERIIECDSVVVAGHTAENTELFSQLRRTGVNVHAIGDCTRLGLIAGATRAAADAVSQL